MAESIWSLVAGRWSLARCSAAKLNELTAEGGDQRRATSDQRPVLLAAVAVLLAAACVTHNAVPPLTGPVGPAQVADFSLPAYPGGAAHDIKSDRGSVVLLDVWATWCEPCRDALPIYEDLAKEYGARGFKVYAINVDEDPHEIAKFVAETKLSLPVLLDRDGANGHKEVAENQLHVTVMPTTFLVDRKGNIRHIHAGFDEHNLSQYQAEIEQLLAEPKE